MASYQEIKDGFNGLSLPVKLGLMIVVPGLLPIVALSYSYNAISGATGKFKLTRQKSGSDALAKEFHINFGLEEKTEATINFNGKTYTNLKHQTKVAADAYRIRILKDFVPEQRSFIKQSHEEYVQDVSRKYTKTVGAAFLDMASDMRADRQNLGKSAVVETNVIDQTGAIVSKELPYHIGFAARRAVMLDAIKYDQEANYIPLASWNGQKKPEDLIRNRFIEGGKLADGDTRDAFKFARDCFVNPFRELDKNVPAWFENTQENRDLNDAFYGYTLGKAAHAINKDAYDAYTTIFQANDPQLLAARLETYRDACRQGLIDYKTRAVIAELAQYEAENNQGKTNALFNFALDCLVYDTLLVGVKPSALSLARKVSPFTKNLLDEIKSSGQIPMQDRVDFGMIQTTAKAGIVKSCEDVFALDELRDKTVKGAFGRGADDLAANITALQGIAQGLANELASGKYGVDRVRAAWNNPKTRFAVIQGGIASTNAGVGGLGGIVRGF